MANDMLNVLIVDDDTVDREAVKRALRQLDRKTILHEAETGADAISMMEKDEYYCVFLDYKLPDMDGIHFLRRFYNAEIGLGKAPVVMLTGQGNISTMIDALRLGAQDYLVKGSISTDALSIAMVKAREIFDLKNGHRQAEELLRQSQKMDAVGQLTSGVAHDFNNLLTVVLGNTRLILRRLDGDAELSREDITKKVQAIEIAARNGAELIKRLMVFTRQRKLSVDTVDIDTCVRDTYEMLTRALGEMVEIKLVCAPEGTWPVQIDTGQFQNVLINMAVNARDAMPKGGKLTIETHNIEIDDEYAFRHPNVKTGPYVMIAISDTGTGMDNAILQRIFEPFFTTKPAGEGTGLGLSMVYGFIKQSGGHIHCYSEPGHGTVFRIYLPRIKGEEVSEYAQDSEGDLLTGTETVLVVEDDEAVRTIAISMLKKLGYQTLEAANGVAALQVLRAEYMNVSLIFTDIVMPGGISGIDLVRRAREYYPQIKVLYTSGYTENAIPDYQLVVGENLIGKPYRKEALATKVRQVLDSKQA